MTVQKFLGYTFLIKISDKKPRCLDLTEVIFKCDFHKPYQTQHCFECIFMNLFCTQAINLPLQKGIALLTLPVNNNLHTVHVTYIVYYIHGFKIRDATGCKTRQEVNFQRGDMVGMLMPLSWSHHVASRTWVLRVWRSEQNVSKFDPVLKLNDDIFL